VPPAAAAQTGLFLSYQASFFCSPWGIPFAFPYSSLLFSRQRKDLYIFPRVSANLALANPA
jgi:hypothetical protein